MRNGGRSPFGQTGRRKDMMMKRTANRWAVLAAACLVNLCVGSLYAWSVFASPMAERLCALTGQEIASLSVVFTIANAVGPVTMIGGGFFNDKLGARWVMFIGGLLFGFGMIASGFARSVSTLIVTYGLGVGFGVGMVYGCTVSTVVKLFPDKPGLAGGATTAAYGASSVIMPLAANALIASLDISAAFALLGAVMLVVICAMAFLIPTRVKELPRPNGTAAADDRSWREMLKAPEFYVMLLMLCCGAFSGLMIVSQASPLAQRMVGMTQGQAAAVVSVLALFNTGGRLLSGVLSDRFGVVRTLRGVFLCSAVGLALLLAAPGSAVAFYAGICVVGFCFGSVMGIYPGFTASRFGRRYNSVNYGIMFCGFAAAGFFGPTIMSGIYAASGSYSAAFWIAIVLSLAGMGLTFLCRRPARK